MAKAFANQASPLKKLDAKVIAAKPTRRYRAAAFQVYVLFALVGFVVLAVVARTVPYFSVDLTVSRIVQSFRGPVLDPVMFAISWIGFWPQSLVIGLLPVVLLFATGLRWEAVVTLLAASSAGVATVIKLVVQRPRPTIELVDVIREMTTASFPSGHVLTFTSLVGFLAFLVYTLLKPSRTRTGLLITAAVLMVLMGLSRIYQGHHWFSDVMGAYLLATLWLALSIWTYRWGKPRFFVHQPVAPEAPEAHTT